MPRKPKSKLTKSPKPRTDNSGTPFNPGSQVEISSNDVGFRGSWFMGTVIRRPMARNPTKYLVEYSRLFETEAGKKPLKEVVDLDLLRPLAPREKERQFKLGEEVDAFYNDGWWEGVITEVDDGKFAVYFRNSKEQIKFAAEDLRLHREWIKGEWKPPLEDDTETEKLATNSKEEPDKVKTEELFSNSKPEEEPDKFNTEGLFCKGTLVEVSSDEDGFQGAWFAATIVEPTGKDKYLVEYQSLRTEDDKEFLKEEIDIKHIRPSPPETLMVDRFNKLDEVDALYNDGWWVGVISKVCSNSKYVVYFKTTKEELTFEHSDLRLHQDWINGKWVTASQV
ncbi:protein AGENET DOMAIN (AGD)-CONTAINING P1 [Citrus sinensis]|nr:protein AGENET DOMAIN (AGD)-CONTAINING P1 [Citrus sinensis]